MRLILGTQNNAYRTLLRTVLSRRPNHSATYGSVAIGDKCDQTEIEGYQEYYNGLNKVINSANEEIASKSPGLVALHSRLRLPSEVRYSTLARCLTCRSSHLPALRDDGTAIFDRTTVQTSKMWDNYGLAIFGKNLLTYYVTKHFMLRYPRLPTPVLHVAVDAYINTKILAQIARSWGIESEKRTVLNRYLAKEPYQITLGKLRFYNNTEEKDNGIEIINSLNLGESNAYALAVKSIIAALWTIGDHSLAFNFIDSHILSRKLDVKKLFYFEQPTRELAVLCAREGLERPVSKLLAESGRLSKAPVFIVGVFSEDEKLGEGFGSSLKEAKARAATDALLKWYCYEPSNKQSVYVDPGTVIV